MSDPAPHPSLATLLEALPPALLTLVERGEERAVRVIEILEPSSRAATEPGDLLLLVGAADPDAVLEVLGATGAGAAGVVLRERLATDDRVRERCRADGLPLLALAQGATWSAAHTLLRSALEAGARGTRTPDPYADLFDLADRIGALLRAPVTIEDAQSRVLAYSSGQQDVDPARTSTIVGRRVPREVRDRLRALGVFRHLTTSDEPLFVPGEPAGMRPRFVVPVRAGGEWLGSVWAVVDHDVPTDRVAQVRVATDVVALHLLRLRSQHDLHQQVRLDQVRALLRGDGPAVGREDWLGAGPWRVATLSGPPDLPTEDRLSAWGVLLRRRGWNQPLVGDVDGQIHAVLAATTGSAGSWEWLARVVRGEAAGPGHLAAHAGAAVERPEDLDESRRQSLEVAAVAGEPLALLEERWAEVLLARAHAGLHGPRIDSPVTRLAAHDLAHGTAYVTTLAAVLDHWGDLPGAARALGVHPNTVRNRLARLTDTAGTVKAGPGETSLDLTDPAQRQAAWLECTAARTAQETKSSQSWAR